MDYHLSTVAAVWFIVLVVWELVWKGFALWRAAQREEKWWFIALLVINTAGILPILYLLLTRNTVAKKQLL